MFAALMILQWVAGIIAACIISPRTWIGQTSQVHIHVWASIFLGGAISLLPVALALRQPGARSTRYTIAVGQMLMSSLLIHLTGGRIETHFHVFGSLAFLSFYRDWRVLVPATAVVAADHLLRGIFYPQSVFGVLTSSHWRWIEHAGWVIFEDVFLIISCLRGQREMQQIARRTAELDASEARFRNLIECADDIIYRTDRAGHITFVNAVAEHLMRREADNLLGSHYLSLVAQPARREVQEFYERQVREQTILTYYEFPAATSNGETVWLGQNVRLLVEGGEVIGFQAVARDITERRAAQDALRESEGRYRLVTDSASDAIVTVDERGMILYANATTERGFGYRVDELVGQHLVVLVPEWAQSAHEAGERLDVVTGERHTCWQAIETPARHKDGRQIPVEVSFGEYNKDGRRLFTAILRDITERKLAAKAIKKSEEYRNLFRLANDPILIVEPEGQTVLDVNDKACEVYGFTREEFVGRSLKSISRDAALANEYLNQLLTHERRAEFESVHYRADGTPVHFLINSSVIEFEGRPAILSINRDVTARKRADAALRESEHKFRTLIESMSEGLLQVDVQDRICFVNDRFCEMTDYAHEELLGRNALHLLFDEESRELVRRANKQRLQGSTDSYEVRLRKKSGEVIWTLVGGTPVVNADGEVAGMMGVYTDITERKRAEEQLLHNAFHDALTGLPNRALFLDHLHLVLKRAGQRKRAGRQETPLFAVLFLDFDRFKVVNDSLGHVEGDKLLVLIARRLEESLRPGDVVARLGGDEFTILVDDLRDASDALRVAERINDDMAAPFNIAGREVFTSVSIGIAFGNPSYGRPEDLLRDADIAMYRAKAGGKARYQVFDGAMHREATTRLQLETELRRAFEREEFCLHYQPIVELGSERVVGFEALVRWQHPERGMVLPGEFIHIAEETGLILQLGEWVLREACRRTRGWQQGAKKDVSISVNLSCKQFMQTDLADRVASILRETELDPRYLRLEITESYLMDDGRQAATAMNRLRALGVELSIDDFGTGYSNLSYLHRLPVSQLKIDRSFVAHMQASAENGEIVRTIIALAKSLGMRTVAEGVEESDQRAQLRSLGCEYAQGYLFSKPMDAGEAGMYISAKRLAERSPARPILVEPPH